MIDRLFGTSGIRRTADQLTEEFTTNLAEALGTYSTDKVIAVGRDTRKSSPRLRDEFISGLNNAGKKVIDLGIASTPTVAMASEEYGTGVVVTASHNPPEYNGFKFWRNGKAYSPDEERSVEEIFHSKKFRGVSPYRKDVSTRDYATKHRARILKKIGGVKQEISVLIDCANGAGSLITPHLLRDMGCEVIAVNTGVDGVFPHGLEPTKENLADTCAQVKKSGVDVGIAHDGDADRSAAIDSEGRLIDWDSFLAVLAYGKNLVVTTVDASMRIEEVCGRVIRTPVGDVAVANAVLKWRADFGGEPSGSFIFPQIHLFPDGILTAAVTAKMVSENRFYEVLEEINSYPMERVKIPCEEGVKKAIMEKIRLLAGKKDYDVSYTDGVRLSSGDGWFLIRPSGTEPFMRVTAEAVDIEKLREFIQEGKEMIAEAGNLNIT